MGRPVRVVGLLDQEELGEVQPAHVTEVERAVRQPCGALAVSHLRRSATCSAATIARIVTQVDVAWQRPPARTEYDHRTLTRFHGWEPVLDPPASAGRSCG